MTLDNLESTIFVGNKTFKGALQIDASPGSEKVTNGSFTGDADDWTLTTGWAYSSNTVVHNADGTGTLSQDISAVANEIYKVVFTISALTAGNVTVAVGGVSGTNRTANGTYTEYIKATGTGSLTFTPSTTARFTLDDVSVKRVGVAGTDRVTAWTDDRGATAGKGSLFVRTEDGTTHVFGPEILINATAAYMSGGELLEINTPNNGALGMVRWQADNSGPKISLALARNNTVGVHGLVDEGDSFGTISFYGSDGAAFREGAGIYAFADGTPGSSDMPGRLVFRTTLDGNNAATERQRITNKGWQFFTMHDNAGTPVAATGALKLFAHNKSVADDAVITLPAVTSNGFGMVAADTASNEFTIFYVDATGTVTLVSNTANVVANADTDTKVCIGTAATQEPLQIKNRLGAAKVLNVMFWYD